jgi:50S ribosomal protein L16 3-hydroxylase
MLLGKLQPRAFLRRHWQKRPLLVRAALPRFADLVDARTLRSLARRDDVESRIVERRGGRWDTTHGPFESLAISKRNFTLLVSGVNLHVPAADALLRRFAFIPQARLDDVMVSHATPGGGVGPHVDSYDVFLLQGSGRRRWTVWDPGSRLFGEWTCESGDLLYVPPGWKHDGVALEPCFTYSIGFRAPRGAELAAAFLDWLHERGLPDAAYRDPGLRPTAAPARIPDDMVAFCFEVLKKIRWGREAARHVLGRYLTEPKAHVVFRPSRTRGDTVVLDPKTQLLYSGRLFFMNGEAVRVPRRSEAALRELADRRRVAARRLAGAPLAGLLSAWLQAGYARLDAGKR